MAELCLGGGRFRVGRKLGSGSFGEVFCGADAQTGEEVAIKVEPVNTRHACLAHEARLYKAMNGTDGVPKVLWFGSEGDYRVMAIELLGPSLEDLFESNGRTFHLKTVLLLADQLIQRLQCVHAKGLIHRDIKPDNFLVGLGANAHKVFAIDFGLSKRYRDSRTQQHIPYREGKSLTGTARYVSINTHQGREQSRRDDLESVGYMLVYFLRGSLPWQGLKAETKQERYSLIQATKESTPIESLCAGLPAEFAAYLMYCRGLKFEERPDYAYLRRLFRDAYLREGFQYDFVFDWTPRMQREPLRCPPPPRGLRGNGRPCGNHGGDPGVVHAGGGGGGGRRHQRGEGVRQHEPEESPSGQQGVWRQDPDCFEPYPATPGPNQLPPGTKPVEVAWEASVVDPECMMSPILPC
mmetsp:Transcript_97120/g.279543  ORF Transcript_97120/g.279543 Transcript_97120/m.279543 type:complete len:409 (-) Transcript_97120:109-1335(-)